jgi:Family of unknown function (DUF6011)
MSIHMITDPQANFIRDLCAKKDIDPQHRDMILARVDEKNVTKTLASDWITRLKDKPNRPNVDTDHPDSDRTTWAPEDMGGEYWAMTKGDAQIPRGSYGLETPGPQFTNDTTFFSVWISDDGSRWTVRMYVSDERVKLSRTVQYAVLDAIATNPAEAAELFGHEFGKCGICGRGLTNDESRARGIGPVCADRYGW